MGTTYVCTYIRTYIRMYVCMYACMCEHRTWCSVLGNTATMKGLYTVLDVLLYGVDLGSYSGACKEVRDLSSSLC